MLPCFSDFLLLTTSTGQVGARSRSVPVRHRRKCGAWARGGAWNATLMTHVSHSSCASQATRSVFLHSQPSRHVGWIWVLNGAQVKRPIVYGEDMMNSGANKAATSSKSRFCDSCDNLVMTNYLIPSSNSHCNCKLWQGWDARHLQGLIDWNRPGDHWCTSQRRRMMRVLDVASLVASCSIL